MSYRDSGKQESPYVVRTVECPYSFNPYYHNEDKGEKIHWTDYFEQALNEFCAKGYSLVSHSVTLHCADISNPTKPNDSHCDKYGVIITCVLLKPQD